MQRALVSLFLVAVGLAAYMWLLPSESRSLGGEIEPALVSKGATDAAESKSEQSAPLEQRDGPRAATTNSQPTNERSELNRILSGTVRDSSGQAIEGATVSWTPVKLVDPGVPRFGGSYEEWAAVSILDQSDSSGAFELELAGPHEAGVVWTTATGFVGASLDSISGTESLDFRLEPTQAWTVHVLVDNAPTSAFVEVRGFVLRDLVPSDRERRFPETLLMRRVPTEAEPTAFGAIEDCLLQAHVSGKSGPLEGPFLGPDIELEMEPPLWLTGTVFGLEGRLPAQVHVSIEAETGDEQWLATLPCLPDGALMPQDIKRFMSGVYRFQLEGQLIPTQIARIDARQLGSAYDLSFVVESGVPVRFQVVDDLGSAVEGAGCRLVWFDALRGAYEVTSSVLLTDATGDVVFTTAKNTSVFLSCSKAVHAYVEAGPVVGPMDSPLTVTLPRAGLIRGRVTFQGANVERFSIVHYQGDGWGQYAPIAFSDRADGTFELDEAPVGEVELFALAPGYGQSIPVTVEVKSGEVTEVELKLQSGSEGRGRVLDAETRAPIAGLEVLRPARSANDVIGMEVDNPIATELDGRFVVNGLIGPNTRVGFRAEGYPASEAIASVGADGRYDFGLTLIAPETELRGEVYAPPGVDASTLQVEVSGAFYAGPMPVSSAGQFEVSGAVPGYVNLDFTWTGGTYSTTRLLRGKGPWAATVDLSGTHRLRLFVDGLSHDLDELDPARLGFRVVPLSNANDRNKHAFYVPLGQALDRGQLTPGLTSGIYQVLLLQSGQIPLSKTLVQVGESDVVDVRLTLDGEMRAVRIVDANGAPVIGIPVRVPNLQAAGALVNTATDASGLAVLGMLPSDSVALHVGGFSTRQLDLVVEHLGTRDNPTEVEFDPKASVRLIIRDRDVPLEGIEVMVESAITNQTIVWATTNESGAIEVTGVTPGPIRVVCLAPGIWLEIKTAEIGTDTSDIVIQMRRLGSLEVHVSDAAGHPLNGLEVDLRHSEFDQNVSEWVALGELMLPVGAVTDLEGNLLVQGVPNGDYAWTVAGQSGTVHVPANGQAVLSIQLLE